MAAGGPNDVALSFNIELLDSQRLPTRSEGGLLFQRWVVKVFYRDTACIDVKTSDSVGHLPYPHAAPAVIRADYPTAVHTERQCLMFKLYGIYDNQEEPAT